MNLSKQEKQDIRDKAPKEATHYNVYVQSYYIFEASGKGTVLSDNGNFEAVWRLGDKDFKDNFIKVNKPLRVKSTQVKEILTEMLNWELEDYVADEIVKALKLCE